MKIETPPEKERCNWCANSDNCKVKGHPRSKKCNFHPLG